MCCVLCVACWLLVVGVVCGVVSDVYLLFRVFWLLSVARCVFVV